VPTGSARYLVDGRMVDEAECRRLFATSRLPDRMERTAALVEGASILDIGCYAGTFLEHVARRRDGLTLTGVDFDPANLEIARMLNPQLEFVEGSAYELPVPDESVDCVTFQEVIEHLEGPAQALKEINRVLRPGGTLIVTTPNAYYWRHFRDFAIAEAKDRLRRRPPRLAATVFHEESEWNRHIHAWTPSTLLTLIEGNGFSYVTHAYAGDAAGPAERALMRVLPFMDAVVVLKVRKVAPAPARLL